MTLGGIAPRATRTAGRGDDPPARIFIEGS